ncbi:MAG TPA: hypothetical protein GXX75_23065 [Clostridiales bacterium]|nr:hypothetical protein [Clostridiales bacterium]
MDYYDNRNTPQEMPLPVEDILVAENAVIEEVMASNRNTGYVLISYEAFGQDNQSYVSQIRLNVGRDTVIMDESGASLSLYDLMEGMRVDAEFSAMMTRSIPPQSNAFRIIVLEDLPSVNVTTDRVVGIDVDHGFLLTGNPNDMYDQMLFTISDQTVILDRDGNPTELEEIQPGQLVRVEHAIFQTASIPPQSPAYFIQLL